MFLKALTIKGFKSFADPAELALEPGITVVVGPNGSGKSNVVDAMAWVLGAQAPSAVRSQKMEDVIFAGTAARKALGRAEVSLTIDNTDGLLPIDFSEVTITRTLFRSGESEYAINDVSCRLLDIQELLSDSGVGRQQHIIVSQGRIDAVLNARPEERRGIIEEAAGVLKFRKRRERAERRLAATGENLARLQDLVREVRRQIKPLERQAEAARRHGLVVAELGELKTHLAGRELTALTGQLEAGRRQQLEYDERESELAGVLARLDARVLEGEAELSALGASDVAEVLSRSTSLGERIRGQLNVVAERRTRLEGELQSAVDEGLVANLEAESARITAELAVASADLDAMRPEFAELETSEAELTNEQLSFDSQWGDSLAPSPSRAAELRARVEALGTTSERNEQELARLTSRIEAIDTRVADATDTRDRAVELLAVQEPRLPELERALTGADGDVDRSESELMALQEDQRRLDAEASHWQARAEALAQALDEARVRAGAEVLADQQGVLGTLLDLVAIDDGWEPAVEAAIGDALSAVVVDGPTAARSALATLDEQDLTGAVLALGLGTSAAGGVGGAGPSPLGGWAPVRDHVRPLRPDVGPLLDALLADAIVLPGRWQDSIEAILARPDSVFVTRDGDRFSRRGWRLRQGSSGATGAALDEAVTEQERSAEAASAKADRVATAREAHREAQAARKRLEGELQHARNEIERATMTRDRGEVELASLADDRTQLIDQRAAVFHRKQADAAELRRLLDELPAVESEEAEQRNRAEALRESRSTLEERAKAVSTRRTELEVRIAALEERRDSLRARQTETEGRLERLVRERERARVRRERIEASLGAVLALDDRLVANQDIVTAWTGVLETEQRAQSEAAKRVAADLSTTRGERAAAEKELTELRERRSRLELSETEYRVKLEALVEAVRRELDTDPEVAMAAPCPELPDGTSPEARVRDLERELKIMGAINPLALEEFEELKERHDFLQGQLDDVKSARRDLHKLIRSIDDEIVGVFSAAYADVSTNFTSLFQTLFPGGKGELKLLNSEDILNCGIEIEAKPSGKNVKKLSLLSGGERSLVALAFLFAVFRSRPSPFYVMDEVEAALDDMNLSRFLALVEEFRSEAQLIIVSHQKRTMEAADVLYGVSMKPGGSSKVVTEKVDERKVGQRSALDATAGRLSPADEIDLDDHEIDLRDQQADPASDARQT
ncbi:MAG: chromosome segregation protein SMC [Actinomycetota bacterium]